MTTTAWLINPFFKSYKLIDYDTNNARIEPIMIPSAYSEGVNPREYKIVKEILGADDMLHVAPYTVKKTTSYVYKLWVRDIENPDVPGAKLFKTDAVFKDMMLLVKYKNTHMPILTSDELIEKMIGYYNTKIMFYEPPDILECEDPINYIRWIKKDSDQVSTSSETTEEILAVAANDTSSACNACNASNACNISNARHGYILEDGIFPRDFLYTCALCHKACGNKKCSLCKNVYYCDSNCQKSHWKIHKNQCKNL